MSNSKHLPLTFDVLCHLNRDQLERFSIVCRPLKNLINRYFHSKPYRVFDRLDIRGGLYALVHNHVRWHPNRDDYSVQQFLAGHECTVDESKDIYDDPVFYSFADMLPYLGPTLRIKLTSIYIAEESIYNPEHVAEMESIAYLWRDGHIRILNAVDSLADDQSRIAAEDFQPILNSPTILQCRKLTMCNANFSFKDYKVLYTVNVIKIFYCAEEEIDPSYWAEFLEQFGVKPIVLLQYVFHEDIVNALECFKKAFCSAVLASAFKIVFPSVKEPLTEFRKINKTSGEILELKEGLPTNCENIDAKNFCEESSYTLERSSI